jgi:putative FmdB family regulatory protein
MPIYKYKCISCNIEYEVERSIHEENSPYCCNYIMAQIYHAPGLSFKGTGWGKDA